MRLYAALPQSQSLASSHASAQEYRVYEASNKLTYRTQRVELRFLADVSSSGNLAAQTLSKLKKRSPAASAADAGTNEDVERKQKALQAANSMRVEDYARYTHNATVLKQWGDDFVLEVPDDKGDPPTEEGRARDCARCKVSYIVKAVLSDVEQKACVHHWVDTYTHALLVES